MGKDSKIEWTHHSFNCWRGCEKVSAGCKNCYAETQAKRFPLMLGEWGSVDAGGTRVVASETQWKEPLKWDKAAKKLGERHRVFCASIADVFEDWQGPMLDHNGAQRFTDGGAWHFGDKVRALRIADVRQRLFSLIDATPNLDWLLLTKRPENIIRFMPGAGWVEPEVRSIPVRENVWFGTSVENQQTADERIPHLLNVPAKVRFLSCEPLLGPVELHLGSVTCDACGFRHGKFDTSYCIKCHARIYETGRTIRLIDLVIAGGESGHGARPMLPDWARSLRDQCTAAGVAFFMKQWGNYGPGSVSTTTGEPVFRQFASKQQWINKASTWINGGICLDADGKLLTNGADFDTAKYPVTVMHNRGKSEAGRILDGRTWDEFPEAR